MDLLRATLAVISILTGIGLVFAGTLRLRQTGSIRKSTFLWVYAVLFLGTAVFLWQVRKNEVLPNYPFAEKPSHRVESLSSSQQTDMIVANPAGSQNIAAKVVPAPKNLEEPKLVLQSANKIVLQRDLLRQEHLKKPPVSMPTTFEDRTYAAVEHVFNSIERFFFLYGAPSAIPPRNSAILQTEAIAFPQVNFRFGTAELSENSRNLLLEFAETLRRHPQPEVIEIQVRTDEGGLEPYNYLLTQARAEVVRDQLLEHGITISRLKLVPMGSDGADSLGIGSQIRFVTRP